MNGIMAWNVWEPMPDDGEAAVARASNALLEPVAAKRDASVCGSPDSYGCVDWFDFESHRDGHGDGDRHRDGDEDMPRREARGVPA
jgi:hypothetical protein